MKKFRKLISVIASAAMVFSMLVMPASAETTETLASFAGETINFGMDFETLTAAEVASWYTDDQITNGGFRSETDNGVVTGYNGGQALSPTYYRPSNPARIISFHPVPNPTTGVQHFRFDYRAGTIEDITSLIELVSANNRSSVVAVAVPFTATKSWGNEWVNVDIKMDYETKTWSVTAVPYNSSLSTYTNSGTWNGSSLGFRLNAGSNTPASRTVDNTPAIDNFYWTTEVGINETVTVTISATADGNGTVTGAGTYNVGDSVTLTATPDNGYEFAGWYDGNTKVSDNAAYTFTATKAATYTAKFVETEEDEPDQSVSFEGEKINFGMDFETLTASEVSSWYTDNQITNGGFRSETDNGVVTGYNGGQALSPTYYRPSNAARTLSFHPVPNPTTEVQHFRFDYRAGTIEDITSIIELIPANNRQSVVAVAVPFTATKSWGNEWVNVDIKMDYEAKTWSVTAVPYNSSLSTYTNKGTWNGSSLGFRLNAGSNAPANRTADNTPAIDNFYWTTEIPVYTFAPPMTSKIFSVYAGDKLQSDLNSVLPTTDKVTVDFGQHMNISDMNSDNIYITLKNSEEKIETTGSYENKVYTMAISSQLDVKTSYTIHVKPVKNTCDYATNEFTLDFTVSDGIYNSKLKQLVINNTPVTTAAQVTPGAQSQIEFDYTNTTGTPKTLYIVVAYYNDDMVVKADYFTKDVSEQGISETYKVDYTVPSDVSGYDTVRIMSWDGFTTMLSMGGYLEFK